MHDPRSLRPFITTLKFLAFMTDYDGRGGGVRTIQFSKSIAPKRKLIVQLHSNGLHRAFHEYDGVMTTEPTSFTTGPLMLVAILHEATRDDNRRRAADLAAGNADLAKLLRDAIPFIKQCGTVNAGVIVDEIQEALLQHETRN